jgi:hypothetical protein
MPLLRKPEEKHAPENGEPTDNAEQEPPNERTRLLPNRVGSGGNLNTALLTPDDPAVSPYNLRSIRILRYFSLLFIMMAFVWWVLLLVSLFVTPPGFHAREGGFLAFGFATLTMANMGFVLVFFGVPSKSVRILAFAMSVSASSLCSVILEISPLTN